MDNKAFMLTAFLFACLTGVTVFGIYTITHMSPAASPSEIIQMYFAGGFGVITGGSAGVAIGKSIKKKGDEEDAEV